MSESKVDNQSLCRCGAKVLPKNMAAHERTRKHCRVLGIPHVEQVAFAQYQHPTPVQASSRPSRSRPSRHARSESEDEEDETQNEAYEMMAEIHQMCQAILEILEEECDEEEDEQKKD